MRDTENKIKNATVDLLLKEGNFGFTLYDVAERSKANRTVIHYYFRSRDNLLAVVTREILSDLITPRHDTLVGKENLKTKILNFLEESDKICEMYPYIDVFLMVRHTTSKDLQNFLHHIRSSFDVLISEVQDNIDRKEIHYPNPKIFLSDLFSLSSFSYIFSNFFCTLELDVMHQTITKGCKEKNARIMDILFGQKD